MLLHNEDIEEIRKNSIRMKQVKSHYCAIQYILHFRYICFPHYLNNMKFPSLLLLLCCLVYISISSCAFPPNNIYIEVPRDLQFQSNYTFDYFYFTGKFINTKHFDYHFTIVFERNIHGWYYVGFLNDNVQMYTNETVFFDQKRALQFQEPFQLSFKSEKTIFRFESVKSCCKPGDRFQMFWSQDDIRVNLELELTENTFLYGDRGFLRYSTTNDNDFGAYFALPNFKIHAGSSLLVQSKNIEYPIDFGSVYFEKQFIHLVDPSQAFKLFIWAFFMVDETKYALNCPFEFETYKSLCVVTRFDPRCGYRVEHVKQFNYFAQTASTTAFAPSIFVETDQNFRFLINPQNPNLEVIPGFFDGLATVEIFSANNQTKSMSIAFLEFHNFVY